MNIKLPEACTLSKGAGSSFAHHFCLELCCPRAVAICGSSGVPAWSLSPLLPLSSGDWLATQSICSPGMQDLPSCTSQHLQLLSLMLCKQFSCTPALAPLLKHWFKSFTFLLSESPSGKKNAVYSRDFPVPFDVIVFGVQSLTWWRLRCFCLGSIWCCRS